MSTKPIVVVGSANYDLTVYSERLPAPGETVLGGTFAAAIGGKGANQATAARRAGAEVVFVSATGEDANGRVIREHFDAEGVRALWARIPAEIATGVALILVDSEGRNSISVAPGANGAMQAGDLSDAPFAACSHVLISLEIPLPVVREAARRARAAGCTVVLNPAPAAELPDDLLCDVDLLVPNEHEVELLAGPGDGSPIERAARRFLGLGGTALIVTLGEKGATVITSAGSTAVPGFAAAAVDTVGAGDCFCGVLVATLATGADLPSAVRRAHRAASLSVQTRGAIPSFPSSKTIDEAT